MNGTTAFTSVFAKIMAYGLNLFLLWLMIDNWNGNWMHSSTVPDREAVLPRRQRLPQGGISRTLSTRSNCSVSRQCENKHWGHIIPRDVRLQGNVFWSKVSTNTLPLLLKASKIYIINTNIRKSYYCTPWGGGGDFVARTYINCEEKVLTYKRTSMDQRFIFQYW